MAGESASELARRQREKAERLNQAAANYERGAEGEARTAAALAELPAGWTALNDVAWPGRARANIDHVVIGPAGVFVIDTKNWSNRVTVSKGTLWCGRFAKTREVEKAADAAHVIAALLPMLSPTLVRPMMCFVQDQPIPGDVGPVAIVTTSDVVAVLRAHRHMLSATQVEELVAELRGQLAAATAPRPAASPVTAAEVPAAVEPEPRRRGRRSILARLGLSAAMLTLLVAVPVVAATALRIAA